MIAWLIPLVGEKFAKPAFYGILLLVALIVGGVLAKCTGGNEEVVAQAEQGNRSGAAIGAAASEAVETLDNRQVTDAAIETAVQTATKDIENAETVDAVRAAVIDGVCKNRAHRNDPGCQLRKPSPE